MAVRFVLGRAGSGKTHHCLEAIRSRLRASALEGSRLVFLVPEQAGLQMERAIIAPDDIPGSHRANVLSFRRLAVKVLESAGGSPQPALSEPARIMVLRFLAMQHAGELRYYRRVDRLAGFVARLSDAVAELIEEAIHPDELAADADSQRDNDSAHQAKLHDLHRLYVAYLDFLGTTRLDPSQYLQAARHALPHTRWVVGSRIWIDGFASYSGQETLTLVDLCKLADDVTITMLIDPSMRSDSSAGAASSSLRRLFGKALRTYTDLVRCLREAGVKIDEPILLNNDPQPRFAKAEALATLEKRLFAPPSESPEREVLTSDGAVELAELPSRRLEVEYAVSRVVQWVQDSEGRRRFRDIAIIVRDLELYHELLGAALDARGIPYFIDRRRSMAHHPLVELVRAAVRLCSDRLSLDSVRFVLKTDLLPLAEHDADELENYLIAHGIHGERAWRGDDWTYPAQTSRASQRDGAEESAAMAQLSRINQTRRTFVELVSQWLELADQPGGHNGVEWSEGLRHWLDRLGVEETVAGWSLEAQLDGDTDQAAEHQQVWRDLQAFLDDLAFAFSDTTLTVDDLSDVLGQGLSSLTLGLAPPMVDQLLVGSVERSRHPDIEAAILIGFNDGVFPAIHREQTVLNDDDRMMMRAGGVNVGAPSRERQLDESMLVYIALTRASESLLITYASSDDDGSPLRPSPYLDALHLACPGVTAEVVADTLDSRDSWDILTARDVAVRLALEFRLRPRASRDDPPTRTFWNELYDRTRTALSADPSTRPATLGLGDRVPERLTSATVRRLFPTTMRTSVSQLEAYAACPFQYFSRSVLRLHPRAEATWEAVDVGLVHHAVLENFVANVASRHVGLQDLSDDELMDGLAESVQGVAQKLGGQQPISSARDAYLLRRSVEQLARLLNAQRDTARVGRSKPKAVELPFGFGEQGLPGLQLNTPKGRSVLLRGYIDRVDIAEHGDELLGVVIDYKRTRNKKLDWGHAYHGLSLQLLAYLLVVARHGHTLAGRPVRPIAGLYVGLSDQYDSVSHPAGQKVRDTNRFGIDRLRGVVQSEAMPTMDRSMEPGHWSKHYNVHLTKGGEMGYQNHSDAVDPASFDRLLGHTTSKLGELADGILDGNVDVLPYRLGQHTPCSWCEMASVCRFEAGLSAVRSLETLTRTNVLERIGQESQSP